MFSSYIQGVINLLSNRISSKRKGPRYIFYLFVFSCSVEIGVISAEKIPKFNPDYMRKALTEYKIYPYLLPDLPKYPIEVYFGEHEVTFGNRLYWNDTKDEPTSVHWPAKKDREYILAAIGPDGTGIWNLRCFFEHWLVGNIPGDDVKKGNLRTEYLGTVGHYHGIGWFRIIFVVFEQLEKNLTFDGEVLSIFTYGPVREAFNIKDFREYFHLGPPLAVNFCVVYNNVTDLPY